MVFFQVEKGESRLERLSSRVLNVLSVELGISQLGVDRVLNVLSVELGISQLGVDRVLNVGLRVSQKKS
jgi:hypothetical protein